MANHNRNKLNILKNNDLSFLICKPYTVQLHINRTYILTTIHLIFFFTKRSLEQKGLLTVSGVNTVHLLVDFSHFLSIRWQKQLQIITEGCSAITWI